MTVRITGSLSLNSSRQKEDAMEKDSRQKNRQKGIAMIIVVCIMAVLTMMSLALLLASSVMTQNSGHVWQQEQARILAVSLADELEKDLTVTKAQEQAESKGSIREYVNEQITSGSWESQKEEGDSRAVRSFLLDPGVLEGLGQSGDVSGEVQLSWQAGENGYADASLSVKVICTYQKMSYSVTTVYTANEEKQGEDGFLSWMRSERR